MREPRIDEISNFIESEMARLSSKVVDNREEKPSMEMLNIVFREILDQTQIANRKS